MIKIRKTFEELNVNKDIRYVHNKKFIMNDFFTSFVEESLNTETEILLGKSLCSLYCQMQVQCGFMSNMPLCKHNKLYAYNNILVRITL